MRRATAARVVLACLIAVAMASAPGLGSSADSVRAMHDPSPERLLHSRLERLAASSPGVLRLCVKHLESGAVVEVRGAGPAPMASVFKFPIALAVLHAVERGELALDEPVALRPADMAPSWSPIADRHPDGIATYSVHDLLDSMLVLSDNTAGDVLLRRVGGPAAVTAFVRTLGIDGLRIDRSELEMGRDWYGVAALPPESTWTRATLRATLARVPDSTRARAARAYARDRRDTATPEALVRLLDRTWHQGALGPALTDTLFSMMRRCRTSDRRLRAGLPPGTPLADKTGSGYTWDGVTACVNDAGVLTLPDGGHVAVVVMIQDARGPLEDAERVIAEVARAVWETWGSSTRPARATAAPSRRR